MRRGSTLTLATSDISDIPPDLVNPSAVELVLGIRREYAKKLEQVEISISVTMLHMMLFNVFSCGVVGCGLIDI